MPRSHFAAAVLSTVILLPSCSLLIDTNPDGVIRETNAAGRAGARASTVGPQGGGPNEAGASGRTVSTSEVGGNATIGGTAGSAGVLGGALTAGSSGTSPGIVNGGSPGGGASGATTTSGGGASGATTTSAGTTTSGGVAVQAGAAGTVAVGVSGSTAGVGATGGGIATGGVAGVGAGGVATGGAATGGAATGGAATGGSASIPTTGRPFVPVTNSCQGLATLCQGESCCTSITIPGGTFPMGASSTASGSDYDPEASMDVAEHQATVATFALDKYEVTVGRFRKFVAAYDAWHVTNGNPKAGAGQHPIANNTGWGQSWKLGSYDLPENADALKNKLKCQSAEQTWKDFTGIDAEESYPINCIDWFMASAFCIWDDGRLPTEAEWEYAAAGGVQNRPYPWGTAAPSLGRANCADSDNSTHIVVGSKPAGAGYFGHLDLAGSMSEWNFDWYHATWYGTASTPVACNNCANRDETIQRVMRGGSWILAASQMRVTIRSMNYPTYPRTIGGIRCARQQQ